MGFIAIEPSAMFNLIYGMNGSGKTSLLEAIYYLAHGKSFRAHLASRIIQYQADNLSIFARISYQNNYKILPVGIERSKKGDSQVRIANENVKSIVELAKLIPTQVLTPDSRLLLSLGSKYRRQFIDWGVFHVEPQFFAHWQRAQRVLKQRNAACKQKSGKALVQLWDEELVIAAQEINQMRDAYVQALTPLFSSIMQQLFAEVPEVTVSYYPGWLEDQSLLQQLKNSIERDLQLGYTQYGPHRADLILKVNKIPAHDNLSQGQQKLVVYALHLARGILLQQQTNKSCVYLLDDLAAELDDDKRRRLLQVLHSINAQVFITEVNDDLYKELITLGHTQKFHVERGQIISNSNNAYTETAI